MCVKLGVGLQRRSQSAIDRYSGQRAGVSVLYEVPIDLPLRPDPFFAVVQSLRQHGGSRNHHKGRFEHALNPRDQRNCHAKARLTRPKCALNRPDKIAEWDAYGDRRTRVDIDSRGSCVRFLAEGR